MLNVTGGTGDFESFQLETEDLTVDIMCRNGTSFLQTFSSDLPPPTIIPFPSTTCNAS